MRAVGSVVTMSTSEPDTSALRAALEQLVDELTEQSDTSSESEHLARVRGADQVRRLAAEETEQVLDAAIVNARHARPEGATWAALGDVLGTTGQAMSKRAGVRSFSRQRRRLSGYERAQRREQRYREKFGDNLPPQWQFTAAYENRRESESHAPKSAAASPTAESSGQRPTGVAFWRAQGQHEN